MADYKKMIITIFTSAVCASFLFIFLYNFNNKYTLNSPQPINGILKLEKKDIDKYIFIIYDWEFYDGELYTPEDFKNGKPDSFMEYISIGERTSMTNNSTFGNGTYRLNLFLPDEHTKYAIFIPEIYSSYNLYINDKLEIQMGDINTNRAEIQSKILTFSASGQTQILLNVSNTSHYYSGMIYPLSFGSPKAINTIRDTNIFISIFAFVCSFICFAVSFYMGLLIKQSKLNILTFLTFALSVYTAQDLVHYFTTFSSEIIYVVGFLSFYMIYTFIIALHNRIFSINRVTNIITISISVSICLMMSILAIFSGNISIQGRELISNILEFYKWCCGIYLVITAIIFSKNSNNNYFIILFGDIFFAVSLIFDRIYNVYEPIYGCWFIEISSFVLIICLGLLQWKNVADAIAFKLTFAEEKKQMKRQIEIHKNHYEQLSKSIENTKKLCHDMKHHLRIMQNLLKSKNYNALSNYMDTFEKNIYIDSSISYCKNITIDTLLNYYSHLCDRNNIYFKVKFKATSVIYFPDTDITILLGNLLENAFEACQRQTGSNKFINVKGSCISDNLFVNISNSFDDRIKKVNNNFLSSKTHREGIGIKSVNSVVEKYDGVIDFEINDTFSVFVNIAINCSHDNIIQNKI